MRKANVVRVVPADSKNRKLGVAIGLAKRISSLYTAFEEKKPEVTVRRFDDEEQHQPATTSK
ncbi:hypothetical protein [Roseiconus lacunae]|uniref:hypothetical protein n=1 Tax=Roseiconus lacunae TaxID=2605694 RepID=UPI001E4EC6A9|nr:hypothetical protein [Roseiconus lacunae]MCD0459098.1 hypothetical protein [Roseiconus lacunae]